MAYYCGSYQTDADCECENLMPTYTLSRFRGKVLHISISKANSIMNLTRKDSAVLRQKVLVKNTLINLQQETQDERRTQRAARRGKVVQKSPAPLSQKEMNEILNSFLDVPPADSSSTSGDRTSFTELEFCQVQGALQEFAVPGLLETLQDHQGTNLGNNVVVRQNSLDVQPGQYLAGQDWEEESFFQQLDDLL